MANDLELTLAFIGNENGQQIKFILQKEEEAKSFFDFNSKPSEPTYTLNFDFNQQTASDWTFDTSSTALKIMAKIHLLCLLT